MTKYSLDSKLAAIYAYLDGVESYKDIAQKYNVNITMLKKWVAKFREHGMKAFQETYTNYSIEFKMDVLNYIANTGASTIEATSTFNIGSPSTVWNWQYLYDTHGMDALLPKKKEPHFMKKETKRNKILEGSEKALEVENERLRMENAYLKKLHALIQEKEKSQNKTKHK